MSDIIIHHIEGRRSLRVIWTCEELQIPYRLVFERGNILGSLMQIRRTFPQMPVAPVVEMDGEFMVESGAIIEAIASRRGGGRLLPPVNSSDYLQHLQWLHFAESSMMQRGAQNLTVSMVTRIPVNAFPQGYRSGIDPPDMVKMIGYEQCFAFADEYLSRKPFFSGAEFGIADIAMHFSIRFAKLMGGVETSDHPNVHRWRREVESRPAYERALCAACPGGTNEYLLPKDAPMIFPAVKPLGFGGRSVAWFLLQVSERSARRMRDKIQSTEPGGGTLIPAICTEQEK